MKKVKINLNSILNFFVGSVITFVGTTYAASQILATDVNFSPKDISWKVDNAEAAINDLYYKVPGVPTGTILPFMGNTAPAGYVICDGTEYNIESHTTLANFIKTQFGSYNYFGGDGETTFKVPDLRGEFLRGTGTNSHTNQGSGAATGVHQDATESNAIGYSLENGTQYTTFSAATNRWTGYVNADSQLGTAKLGKWISSFGGNTASKRYDAYTSRPTNTSVLYIIRY